MLRNRFTIVSLATSLALLSSCYLIPEKTDSTPDEKPIDIGQPNARALSLRLAEDDHSLLTFLRAGMASVYGQHEYYNDCPDCEVDLVFADQPEMATDNGSNGDTKETEPASETNLIEAGVDEADWLKYDNESGHLYYSIQPQWYGGWYDVVALDGNKSNTPEKAHGKIDVFQLESSGTHSALSSYALNENANSISGLYTTGNDQLLALYSKSEPYSDWYTSYYWRQGKVGLESIDTSDENELKQQWQLEIDGYLVDSRRIGNELYLVTRFSPALDGLEYRPWDKATVEKNNQLIANATLSDLLPSIRINAKTESLIPQSRCFVPTAEDEYNAGYNVLTSVTRINLDNPTDWQSSCAIASISSIYMNQDALYLMRGFYWHEHKTDLHRFSLSNLDYTDSVSVPGSMGWVSDKFRIKEQTLDDKKILTLITSTRESNDWLHQLFNYQIDADGKIEWLATLPNEQNPESIGKPGENIRGARIDGSTAYIVTFLTRDPLYKIDLSTPSNPKVLGQLEIPGFSDYLHPVNDNLLIGVGYQNDEETSRQLVKVSLYDVSGNDPAVISEQLIGDKDSWNYSAATWDHHAFSFLDYVDGTYRFTVPANSSRWDSNTYTSTNIDQLSLFEIDTNKIDENNISQALQLVMTHQNNDYYGSNNARSVILGNSIHFAAGNKLASALWNTPQTKQQSVVTNNEPPIYYPIGIDAID